MSRSRPCECNEHARPLSKSINDRIVLMIGLYKLFVENILIVAENPDLDSQLWH